MTQQIRRLLDISGKVGRDPLAIGRTKSRSLTACRPGFELLEGRALMSVGGSSDFTFAPGLHPYIGKGTTRFNFPDPSTTFQSESLLTNEALQADGKLVVVGYAHVYSAYSILDKPQDVLSVARLNADGSLDTFFGNKGVENLQAPGDAVGIDQAVAVAVQADGRIVVVGNLNVPATPGQIAIDRLNADGSPDATFGSGGFVHYQFQEAGSPAPSTVTSLAIAPDGRIVIGGGGTDAEIARFNTDGSLDTSFGTAGQVTLNAPSGVLNALQGVSGLAVGSDGRIAYATTSGYSTANPQIVVGRLGVDGSFDTGFGTTGQVILPGTSDTASGLAIQADGRIVVAGSSFTNDLSTNTSTTHFDVFRLNTDGTLDSSFATGGEATPRSATHTSSPGVTGDVVRDAVHSLAIAPDGKIIVGGSTSSGNTGFAVTLTLARLNPDGTPDRTFGTSGEASLSPTFGGGYSPYDTVPHSVYGAAILPDGKILAVSSNNVGRFLASGAANDFNNDGKTDPAILLGTLSPNASIFADRPSDGGPDVLAAFGIPGIGNTLPAPGNYEGLGVDELGAYLPTLGLYAVRFPGVSYQNTDEIIPIGLKGVGQSIPVPADYTGSGQSEVAVYEPSLGDFVYLVPSTSGGLGGPTHTVPFGMPGAGNSIPAPADYDGVGHAELAVYLPTLGAFAYRPAGGGADVITSFGMPGAGNSIPVPGDYDGSGHTELAVYLPTLGAFAYRPYSGGPEQIIGFGMPGAGNSIPMPGDYDGSGHLELGVYLPTLGAFAYRPAGGGPDVLEVFGAPGSGNSIPFNAAGMQAAGDTPGPNAIVRPSNAGLIDFVPDLAGQPPKKANNSASTRST